MGRKKDAQDIFIPVYIGDFLKKTQMLDAEESGAYFLLLMQLWINDGALKLEHKKLMRAARVFDPAKWGDIWESIEPYFDLEERPTDAPIGTPPEIWITNDRITREKNRSRLTGLKNKVNSFIKYKKITKEQGQEIVKTAENSGRIADLVDYLDKWASGQLELFEPNGAPIGAPVNVRLTSNTNTNTNTEEKESTHSEAAGEPAALENDFFPISLDEVKKYASAAAVKLDDPEGFFNYWTALGWKDSRGNAFNWRAKATFWDRDRMKREKVKNSSNSVKTGKNGAFNGSNVVNSLIGGLV